MKTDNNGRLVKRTETPADKLASYISGPHMKEAIAKALPRHLTPDRMCRIAVTAIRTTPGLAECTQASFVSAIMACSVLGLEPNTPLGQAYLIPFNNRRKGVKEVQLIIGYQGEMDLVRRSGQVASIQAFPVFKGDEFSYQLGLRPDVRHVPCDVADRENPANLTHVYAVVKLKDTGADPIFVVLTRQQVEASRMRGASGHKIATPWDTDYVAMALKTAVRAVFRWAPRSAEMAVASAVEERSERGATIAPALPVEATEALLGTGAVSEEEASGVEDAVFESEPEQPPPREPGQEG